MLFVFNDGGNAASNGFADTNGAALPRALIIKAVDRGEHADASFEGVRGREFRYP